MVSHLLGKSLFKYRDWFALMTIYNFITLILIMVIIAIALIGHYAKVNEIHFAVFIVVRYSSRSIEKKKLLAHLNRIFKPVIQEN